MLKITKGEIKPIFFQLKQDKKIYQDLSSTEKDTIKDILLREQHFRCAYCMCRISSNNSTIEHYIPQSKDISKSLDYHNLFAVCTLTRKLPRSLKTCDDRRGNIELHIDPRKQTDIDTISYTRKGEILSANTTFNNDLKYTLNLNVERLKNNRRSAWESIKNCMIRKRESQLTKNQIQKYLDKLQAPDNDTPYSGFLIFMLQKRLRRIHS